MVASVFDYPAMQLTADELIRYFGMGAVLRSLTGIRPDRPCTVAIIEYNPREKPTEMANPTDRKVVMSPLDPTTGLELALPPDDELDALVTFVQPEGTVENGLPIPMTCKPKKTSPAGIDCLWEFTIRR
jgi:hypothetical protein